MVVLPAWSTELRLRDAVTGAPLDARLELYTPADPRAADSERIAEVGARDADRHLDIRGGRAELELAEALLVRASLPGYRTLLTLLEPGARGWTLWLTPLQGEELAMASVAQGSTLLAGVVRDGVTLAPTAGARVRVEPLGATAVTGADGRFALLLPAPDQHHDPQWLRLEVELAGYSGVIDESIPWLPGALWRPVDLGSGPAARHRHQDPLFGASQTEDPTPRAAALGVDPDQPPLSLRVGFADASCTQTCCTGNCSHVCVFDLETYVRRGITYEWIGSWTQDSLRAGTVAYRSYGAWHALNPPQTRPYDICSSACCQVNGPNVIAAGTAAARATAGLMLKRNDAVFRSEYSAENNCLLGALSCSNADLSCGNGFNGSPTAGWPCLQDEVGLNRDCFGHGRGMSQWGTQRWSLSPHFRSWPWIVNHYYNAQGTGSGMRTAAMTRALAIVDAAAEPTMVVPGEEFDIIIEAQNRAAESHQAVLIGASIRRGSDAFISDPAQDRLVELDPGVGLATRSFRVPSGTPPDSYALWVSLYLDIDGDGAISAADLVQSLVQFPGALQVVAVSDAVFGDGFED